MLENKGRYIIDFDDFPKKREKMPELEVKDRIDNFDEVELGMSAETAQEEARRCLSCRRCLGCALCLAVCKPKAIVFEQEDEIIDLMVDDVIISLDDVFYMPAGRSELGFGKYKNVICVTELERALDDKGPFGGLLLRPFDGDVPENMAIIFDGDLGDETDDTLQTASHVLEKVDGISISLFAGDNTGINANGGINVKKAEVEEVKEIEETGNLTVSFTEGGNKAEEEFDMIVIASKMKVLPEIKKLQDKLS